MNSGSEPPCLPAFFFPLSQEQESEKVDMLLLKNNNKIKGQQTKKNTTAPTTGLLPYAGCLFVSAC